MAWFSLLGMLVSCEETQADPNQFNAHDESLSILVGIADLQDPQARSLFSSTGIVEVATAQISPGGGPIGTLHQIQVEIAEEYTENIQEVRINIDSGTRGYLEYILTQDSAQTSLYFLELESVGEEGEEREDVFVFSLWDLPAPAESTEDSSWLP